MVILYRTDGRNNQIMQKSRNPILFFIIAWSLVNACAKPLDLVPEGKGGSTNAQSVLFFGVTINPNASYSFNIPQITGSILDSGSISAYFRSSLVILDTWYPLPYYSIQNDSVTSFSVSEVRLGSASILNTGTTESTFDYRFDIAAP
jgi:hypothetical protein